LVSKNIVAKVLGSPSKIQGNDSKLVVRGGASSLAMKPSVDSDYLKVSPNFPMMKGSMIDNTTKAQSFA
jgi:hypothetical protein